MKQIDVNTFIGRYPYRDVAWEASDVVRALGRVGTDEAWVSNLTAVFWRDPMAGNAALYMTHERYAHLRPVPAIHPGLPEWEAELDTALARRVPTVRCDPMFYGLAPGGNEMQALLAACADRGMPMTMAVRLEDVRQRHPNDSVGDITAATVRQLIRSHPTARLLITHADREFVEQVHFGATPDEARRILWDICWIWGPPEDHLELLLETVGVDRFAFGTGIPLRLPETTVAKLDLLNLTPEMRTRLTVANVQEFVAN